MMRSKYRFAAMGIALLTIFGGIFQVWTQAQIAIQIEMSQSNYLAYEPVFVRIGLKNYSAHPIAFGEAQGLQGKIYFEIESLDAGTKTMVPLIDPKKLPPVKGTLLPPGGTKTLTFRLSDYYDLRRKGKYTVTAAVSHPQLKADYESNRVYFDIISGIQLWKTTVGIPDYIRTKAENARIETRDYALVTYHSGKNKVYSLVIEDKDHVYAVKRVGFDLGPNLKPKCEVDFLSRVNLMVPASPKVFAYYQYNLDGRLEKKNIYIKTSTTPVFVVNHEKGEVLVAGGREARKDVDYEEIKDLPFMEDMNTDVKVSDFNDDYYDSAIERSKKRSSGEKDKPEEE